MSNSKSDMELFESYRNGELEKLSIDELKRLTALVELRSAGKQKAIPEPHDNLESFNNETKYSNDNSIHLGVLKRYENTYGKGKKFQEYEKVFENLDSDTGCEAKVDAWSPADTYSSIIWNTTVCKANLLSIAVKGIDIKAGDGLTVQIRQYGQFPAPTELNSCECASCASISLKTYSLTLKQYNLEGMVCVKDVWDVGQVLVDSYINSMSDSFSAFIDYRIYSELAGASAGTDVDLDNPLSSSPSLTGSCCIDQGLYDLYNKIHEVVDGAKEGTNPKLYDTLLVSPSVLGVFKRMATPSPMYWMSDLKTDGNGNLVSIAGLNVVSYCRATSVTDASGAILAIILDSNRAVGACFGQEPKLYKTFIQGCNAYQIDFWSFFACNELDTSSIAFIRNP